MKNYLNKSKRVFIIKKDNKTIQFKPMKVVALTDEEYKPLKNFKDIICLDIIEEKEEIKEIVKKVEEIEEEEEKQPKKRNKNKKEE